MFRENGHDFGTVIRGSKPEYRIELKNTFNEVVEIHQAWTSCRCVDVSFTNKVLQPGETSEIIIKFNTLNFNGQRSATVTVSFSKPRYAEVQLKIKGFIRSDLWLEPGAIDFGTGAAGSLPGQTVIIRRFGNRTWRIVDVRSAYTDIAVSLEEVWRGNDRVEYAMRARIKETAAPGIVRGELLVIAHDGQQELRFPVQFNGKVSSPLEVSPHVLDLETLQPGSSISKRIVLRGEEPFKVVDAQSACPQISVHCSADSKKVHVVEVTYVAAEQAGPQEMQIRFVTDLPGGQVVQLPVTVQIAGKESGAIHDLAK